MHEAGMVQAVLDIVVRRSGELGVRPLTVHLLAGDDIGTSDESLRFYWEELSRNTIAEGATLEIEHTPDGGLRLAAIDVDGHAPETAPPRSGEAARPPTG